ncbi:hypothetical protein BDP27DRAFT_1370256 [Rhodocollybia butyracea]|uniref:LAGLIDADG homing endonuclease n=1 Tax=Rhodocollybia butyracea TaxID=206335 RepID=A0A9P5PCE8_9AGAR|nr:hypothetical protein BDP27DRAFT_1370256 [Rhodocollybia butyracea]
MSKRAHMSLTLWLEVLASLGHTSGPLGPLHWRSLLMNKYFMEKRFMQTGSNSALEGLSTKILWYLAIQSISERIKQGWGTPPPPAPPETKASLAGNGDLSSEKTNDNGRTKQNLRWGEFSGKKRSRKYGQTATPIWDQCCLFVFGELSHDDCKYKMLMNFMHLVTAVRNIPRNTRIIIGKKMFAKKQDVVQAKLNVAIWCEIPSARRATGVICVGALRLFGTGAFLDQK